METAKLFTNGRSQAVRLPKEFRFKGKEVFIKKTGAGILLLPKEEAVWDTWNRPCFRAGNPFFRNGTNQKNSSSGKDWMNFLLDTDICIYLINKRPHSIISRFKRYRNEREFSRIPGYSVGNAVVCSTACYVKQSFLCVQTEIFHM